MNDKDYGAACKLVDELTAKVKKQAAEIERLNRKIDNMKFTITYLLDRLPKPVETPEEVGKRIAKEALKSYFKE